MSAKILKMNKVDLGKTKAFFTVAVGGFEIEGLKLVEGNKGFFVGMPSRSYNSPRDGTKQYIDIVKVTDKVVYGEILEAAKAEYARRGETTVKANTSNLTLDEDDDSDDLPF